MDGLELTASLFLLAQYRAGRRTGVLAWAALLVGTAASLAANIAVGGYYVVGRALAGWPAISLLISIKLLFSMIDYTTVNQRTTVRDDQQAPPTVPDVPQDRPADGTGRIGAVRDGRPAGDRRT